MPYKMPEFEFTHAAQVHAASGGGVEALRAAAIEGVVDLMDCKQPDEYTGDREPLNVGFHCFCFAGGFYDMIMTPTPAGTMRVDFSETEELTTLEEGPFAGFTVLMPKPFSE